MVQLNFKIPCMCLESGIGFGTKVNPKSKKENKSVLLDTITQTTTQLDGSRAVHTLISIMSFLVCVSGVDS